MSLKVIGCYFLALMLALAACSPIQAPTAAAGPESPLATPVPTPADDEGKDTMEDTMKQPQSEIVALAQTDLAARLSIATDQIAVREVRQVTWPDASLGCRRPGQMYAQVLQPGWLIQLAVGEDIYLYHSGEAQKPFLCENSSFGLPRVTPKTDELVPPPDRDVQ